MQLILASASQARARLLVSAGIDFAIVPASVDEHAIRRTLESQGQTDPAAVALELASAKALEVSARAPGRLVIGADQILAFDGTILTKPENPGAARKQLLQLRGRQHRLVSAAACATGRQIVWTCARTATLTMRDFSTEFLDRYLAAVEDRVTSTVGGYEIEGLGIQLFSGIEGDLFTIQGLPLIELLDYLRTAGAIKI
jgi:septum formation protein